MENAQKTSWIPMILVAATAFVSALDATFMNVSISQLVADLDTDVATIQKIINAVYEDAMKMVMMVTACLMAFGGIMTLFLKDVKKK